MNCRHCLEAEDKEENTAQKELSPNSQLSQLIVWYREYVAGYPAFYLENSCVSK